MSEATQADQGPRWWSRAIQIGAVMAIALLLLGPIGTKFGIWDFGLGIMLMMGAAVLSAIGLIGGLWGYMISRSNGYMADRSLCGVGAIVSALVLGLVGMQALPAFSVPGIHNISTDINDPPTFNAIAALRGEGTNPLDYDAAVLGPLQSEAYPYVQPLQTPLDREAAFTKALAVLNDMGLEIVAAEPGGRMIEATYTSFWFGFKDDMVVRIRPAGEGSVVDLRSVSRVGQSDLGANAKRIGKFLKSFQS